MGRGVLYWRNKRAGGSNAWRNNHVLSYYDVIGCNTTTALPREYWLGAYCKNTQETCILSYFTSRKIYFSGSKLVK